MSRTHTAAVAVAATMVIGGLGFASVAEATAGSGSTVVEDSWSGLLVGSNRPTRISQDGVTLQTRVPTTVTTFDLTYPVGAVSGWHSHPGIVIAVVQSGTVTRQVGCKTETFTASQSFTEAEPHNVSNLGTVPAVLSITRIYPTSATVSRLDAPAPVCGSGDHPGRQ
jgi:quercetin dioxygenase-like cupin family protein